MEVDAFSKKSEYVPEIDKNYKFDKDTTLQLFQGLHLTKEFLFKVIMVQENQHTLNKLLQD